MEYVRSAAGRNGLRFEYELLFDTQSHLRSKTAASNCLRRAAVAGLKAWEAIAELDEGELERRLYPSAREGGAPPRTVQRPLPDWTKVREELARRDHQMTLVLLWQEYKAEHPEGYQYSQFAELYRRFEKKLSVVLLPVSDWHDYLGGGRVADAILGQACPQRTSYRTALAGIHAQGVPQLEPRRTPGTVTTPACVASLRVSIILRNGCPPWPECALNAYIGSARVDIAGGPN